MNVHELSIGSLFYPINRNGEIHLPNQIAMKIVSIDAFNVKAILAETRFESAIDRMIYSYDIRDLSPIPFDGDWLLKLDKYAIDNGIKLKDNFGDSMTFEIPSPSKEYYFKLSIYPHFAHVSLPIKYVHQVQSLFNLLTGRVLFW